ncbi:hypothetical protein [Nonomuraea recticatena]|uniref:Uncharacterized protein n=1 Tax=Nonomuraea recticatena TaxID=46178 RepID=A0ABN3SR63_9ACTN
MDADLSATQQEQSRYGGAEHSDGGAQEGRRHGRVVGLAGLRGQDGSTAAAATERRASSDAVTGIAEA